MSEFLVFFFVFYFVEYSESESIRGVIIRRTIFLILFVDFLKGIGTNQKFKRPIGKLFIDDRMRTWRKLKKF